MLLPYSYRPVIARLLLLIQLFMLTNAVIFRHAHRLPDGTVVVHAHPFLPKALGGDAEGPLQPNTHTRQALIWLDALAHATYLELDAHTFTWLNVPELAFNDPLVEAEVAPFSIQVRCIALRGPPVYT
jgi:hypothetical protein